MTMFKEKLVAPNDKPTENCHRLSVPLSFTAVLASFSSSPFPAAAGSCFQGKSSSLLQQMADKVSE